MCYYMKDGVVKLQDYLSSNYNELAFRKYSWTGRKLKLVYFKDFLSIQAIYITFKKMN